MYSYLFVVKKTHTKQVLPSVVTLGCFCSYSRLPLSLTEINFLQVGDNQRCINSCAAICTMDKSGQTWRNLLAYLRIKDENILATPVHLRVWQQSESPKGELIEYTEREQLLLNLLEENDRLSLNRYCRLAHLSRRAAEHLLAKFVRYDIVEPVFEGHKFHFKLK